MPPAAAAAATRGDGTGVGLKSLRERLAALNGTLDVESARGEGTVVAVRLPLGTGNLAWRRPHDQQHQGLVG
ncbi:ATP-binding protein [Amycolatopsis plumensis]|uniref:ATP-binding protein n=1 Tax=Amycolatopsis plumensis TaxID=236508 RepID=UPI00361EF319